MGMHTCCCKCVVAAPYHNPHFTWCFRVMSTSGACNLCHGMLTRHSAPLRSHHHPSVHHQWPHHPRCRPQQAQCIPGAWTSDSRRTAAGGPWTCTAAAMLPCTAPGQRLHAVGLRVSVQAPLLFARHSGTATQPRRQQSDQTRAHQYIVRVDRRVDGSAKHLTAFCCPLPQGLVRPQDTPARLAYRSCCPRTDKTADPDRS